VSPVKSFGIFCMAKLLFAVWKKEWGTAKVREPLEAVLFSERGPP
jgi:hypothetical protein